MSQSNHKENLRTPVKDIKSQWIENQNYCLQDSAKPSNQSDQAFRMQHQQYLKLMNKRKQEAIRKKIEEFGQSSSDQDNEESQRMLANIRNQKEVNNKKREVEFQRVNLHKLQKKENEVVKVQKGSKPESQKQQHPTNRHQVLINSKKSVQMWSKQELRIQQKTIIFPNYSIPIYELNKFKIFFTVINDSCYKLKINWKNEELIFGASFKKKTQQLPTAYYVFSKILKLKLGVMGKKIVSFSDHKSKSSADSYPKNNLIYGKIYKKSRLISRWSEIFAGITKQGLFYHKKLNEKGELLIERGSVTELWTRFQFQDDFLIVKLFENGHKIQLGIPLQDYMSTNSWLYHLYQLSNKNI